MYESIAQPRVRAKSFKLVSGKSGFDSDYVSEFIKRDPAPGSGLGVAGGGGGDRLRKGEIGRNVKNSTCGEINQ